MKLFLDTAVIDEIRTVHGWGVLDGVTTNPTLFAKAGGGSYEKRKMVSEFVIKDKIKKTNK